MSSQYKNDDVPGGQSTRKDGVEMVSIETKTQYYHLSNEVKQAESQSYHG
jgi:hypothetical protein